MEYRTMRRFGQALDEKECKELLNKLKRGILSVTGDEGVPYGVPLDYFYSEEENALYFHGAKEGHKVDSLRRDPRACFSTYDDGVKLDGDWAWTVKSVIAFGVVDFIDDINEAEKYCRALAKRYNDDNDYIEREIKSGLKRVQVLRFRIEHLTGKKIHEA